MKTLGCLRSLKTKKEKDEKAKKKGKSCDVCGEEFPSGISWLKYIECGRCNGGYVRGRAEKKKGDKSDSGCQERGEDFRYRADRGEKL